MTLPPELYWLTLVVVAIFAVIWGWRMINAPDNPVERFIDQRRGYPTEEDDYPNVWRNNRG